MHYLKTISQYKPQLRRLVIAGIICSPLVALTNNLQGSRRAANTAKVETDASKKKPLFFDHRCRGIKTPTP